MFENIILNKIKKQPHKIKIDIIEKFTEKYKDHPKFEEMFKDLKKQINYKEDVEE